MKQEVPEEVKELMAQYVSRLQEILLDEELVGVYVYGSVALGAFCYATSDIDFITVTSKRMEEDMQFQIKKLHKTLSKHKLGKRMDGMYISVADLGKRNEEIEEYMYCANGKINIGHWDINAVTWWTLKNQGITVTGLEAKELPFHPSWSDVQRTMKYNVEKYWSEKISRPYLFLSGEWVESTIVTMGRIVVTLEQKRIVSKDEGLQYMMRSSSEKWKPLFWEVGRIRRNAGERRMISIWRRAKMTRQYLVSTIELCKKKLEEKKDVYK